MLLYFYYYLKVLIATILRKVRKLEPINTKIYVNIGDLKRPFCFKGVREVRRKVLSQSSQSLTKNNTKSNPY